MRDKLNLFIDLNNITNLSVFDELASTLEKKSNYELFSYSIYWYIFMNYKKLLNNEVSLEDFLNYSDVNCKNYKFSDNEWIYSLFLIEELNDSNHYNDSIILVDEIDYNYYCDKLWYDKFKELETSLSSRWNSIFILK